MKAAFEINKGKQSVLILSEAAVAELLDSRELLGELEKSFGALARGEVQCPPRPEITVPGKGFSLTMAAWQPGMLICVKAVNVFEGNLALVLPNHLAIINLFDPDTPSCVAWWTRPASPGRGPPLPLSSHKLLARGDARIATIVGAGVQAREHLRLLPLIREFDEIQICSLIFEHAERLAEQHPRARAARDMENAVRRSDVVCLATRSATPVTAAEWVKPGTHVSSVGYFPPQGELPRSLAERHRLFVETRDAFAPPPVGCAELSGIDSNKGTPLGEVVNDPRLGRTSSSEITVYKAMGLAMEDMVAANLAYRRAMRNRVGTSVEL
jgi:ornithine cyclodeaminase/alanine dehydrogenase-like protein (mu-crystallin family)